MYNLLVIGAGQLGSRHLQSLLKSTEEINIYVIDPSQNSLDISRERALEIDYNSETKKVYYQKDFDGIPLEIEMAVIATTAQHRTAVVKSLLSITKCRFLILEKVLFQNEDDFEQMKIAIEKNGVQAWVNCPRRQFPFYNDIKKYFSKGDKVLFSFDGGEWGLACNSVHMLDIVSFLSGDVDYEVDTKYLTGVLDSKRDGIKELKGRLVATQKNGTEVHLISDPAFTHSPLIRLVSENISAIISETEGYARVSKAENGWAWEEVSFAVKYQSELTHVVFEELINEGTTKLTPFKESGKIHAPFIKALTSYFNERGIYGCPIT